jgi:hypothetical protein
MVMVGRRGRFGNAAVTAIMLDLIVPLSTAIRSVNVQRQDHAAHTAL